MENSLGLVLAVELRAAASLLGLATIAADKGDLASAHARLDELAAIIDTLRRRGVA
jgi:hypothetical protein